jgi:hypothetical protein
MYGVGLYAEEGRRHAGVNKAGLYNGEARRMADRGVVDSVSLLREFLNLAGGGFVWD